MRDGHGVLAGPLRAADLTGFSELWEKRAGWECKALLEIQGRLFFQQHLSP